MQNIESNLDLITINNKRKLDKICGFFWRQLKEAKRLVGEYEPKRHRTPLKEKIKKLKPIILKIIEIKTCFDNIDRDKEYMASDFNKRFNTQEVYLTPIEIRKEYAEIKQKEKELIQLMIDANYNPEVLSKMLVPEKHGYWILHRNYKKDDLNKF